MVVVSVEDEDEGMEDSVEELGPRWGDLSRNSTSESMSWSAELTTEEAKELGRYDDDGAARLWCGAPFDRFSLL